MSLLAPSAPNAVRTHRAAASPAHAAPVRHRRRWGLAALGVIGLVQFALAIRPGMNGTPFEDEGLYVYMGHRMIEHLVHGTTVTEYPGAYFSGAPGLYPPLAAIGDYFAGLQGARTVSLLFALAATVCVNGLGGQLYGRRAGLLGAAAFVLCGSVIYQSDFATFDSMTLFFVAAAAWLTVYSVRHDRYLWAPAVSVLLVCAFYAKYAGAVYSVIVAVLAIAVAAPAARLIVARRTAFMMTAAATLGYFIYALWGQSLAPGIAVTTTSRTVLNPASPASLIQQVLLWVGPWLALAVAGALLTRRTALVSATLLLGVVIGPLEQIRISESTSLAKHVAFGMIFASPLIGLMFHIAINRLRTVGSLIVVAALALLGASGLHYSHQFMTGWVQDAQLVEPLHRLIVATPGKTILGEQPAPERYALRAGTSPQQWTDTYSLSYDNKTGTAAYKEAIDQTSFGVIYLIKQPYAGLPDGSPTPNGSYIYQYLTTANTPYHLVGQVDRVLNGHVVGHWYLFIPTAVHLPVATLTGLPATIATP